MTYDQAKALIQNDYVNRVFGFLRGELDYVSRAKDFVKVHEVVMHQCDSEDNGGKLYLYFQQIMKEYIEKEALVYIRKGQGQNDLLNAFVKAWDNFAMLSKLMDRMFDYLNRYYLKNQALKLLGVTSMELFINKCYEQVKEPLRAKVLQAFTDDRNGNLADKHLLVRVIQCYVQMGLVAAQPMKGNDGFYWAGSKNLTFYENEFEQMFLSNARDEYDKKAQKWISECTAPEYLILADKVFQHEENYC